MARIAFILLCHKDVEGIIRQAEVLTAAGDYISIHFDARGGAEPYARLRAALDANPRVVFARRRVKCGWGEWSLVAASLEALTAAVETFPDATHFYMLSGDCMAIKSAEFTHSLLDAEEADYIEAFDFHSSGWIRTGLRSERLIYRHFFNERSNKRVFYAALNLQRRLGLKRSTPANLEIMIGSQWWCLRRATVETVLEFIATRRDVVRFFRTTWIPDETFFQTLVHHLVPREELRLRTLTFLIFSDYGMPVTFYNDHFDMLVAQDYMFARKVSSEAAELRQRLSDLWTSGRSEFTISRGGRRLYEFLTNRGREGRRFAPRVWEKESSVGLDRELLIIACKKWHIGKRLLYLLRDRLDLPVAGYLFSELNADLPPLGGLESTLQKRARHHRAIVRLLFDYHGTDRLAICVDPSQIGMIRDFYNDRCTVRLLEVQCEFSDAFLIGHAQRIGLVETNTPAKVIDDLLPTLRFDISYESDRLRAANFARFHRIAEWQPPGDNTGPLMAFSGAEHAVALQIAATENLYGD